MPITDRLMSTGSWGIDLVDNAPYDIRRACGIYGSQVYFTPTPIADSGLTLAGLRSAAFYAGMVTRRANAKRSFGGPGLLGFLISGQGGVRAFSISPPRTFTQIISDFFSGTYLNNGLRSGTSHSPTATTVNAMTQTGNEGVPNVKPVLDLWAKQTGNEYRVTPAGLIDYGVATSLFKTTPTVLISPVHAGREGGYKALEVVDWKVSGDIDNYRNKGYMLFNNKASSPSTALTTNTDAVTFCHFNDATQQATYQNEAITANTSDGTDVSNQAQAAANLYASEHIDITVSVREYCLHRSATPGDWVDVYSMDDDIVDRTNPQYFQGDVLYPQQMRLMGFTSPVEHGMGVWVVDGTYNGTQALTNITDYVKWESGPTRLELDSLPYRSNASGTLSPIR